MQQSQSRWRNLLAHEAAGGVVMLSAAVVAIALNNSPLHWLDDLLLATPVSVRVGALSLDKSLLHWINDGLMAIFFLTVGLEIKREVVSGGLSTWRRAMLPAIGALGGMVVPALIYVAINWGHATALRGWAIPSATDIAFAVGVLALLGPRVPPSLKLFLLALAVLDDLGAIIIIAAFYTASLAPGALALAAAGIAALVILNRCGVARRAPYMLVGLFVWLCVLKSGVHATLAGVITALAIPARTFDPDGPSPLESLQADLHPWVTFAILPLFAFANAGVSLTGLGVAQALQPVPLGIAAGLFLGKPIGIAGAVWLAVRSGLTQVPHGATWPQLIAVATLGGIGFTMSLFIGTLAFPDPAFAMPLRVGVLLGSVLSALIGAGLLWRATGSAHRR